MSSDAGGPTAPPPPAYPPPGYAQVPQGQYPPPGYAPPGYPQPSGYYPPPGYSGYPPPGYPPMGPPPVLKPGIIPLRPLGMGDIFNAAVSYIRANPKATLGLTTIVVVVAQVVALLLQIGPLASSGLLSPSLGEYGQSDPTEMSEGSIVGLLLSTAAGGVTTVFAAIVLSGLLTVVVGRAVFGASITVGEAWQRLRGRLWALIGFTVMWVTGATVFGAVVVAIIIGIGFATNMATAVVVGIPLGFGALAALTYVWMKLTFTPSIVVLERVGIVEAINRSFKLVRGDFWRVFGIRLLGIIVAEVIAGAVAVPFSVGGQILLMSASSAMAALIAMALLSIGSAIGQIIASPFSAGVVVLLYTDRRIRAEAFDLVLQTGAAFGPGAPPDSTDHLWLTRQQA